jgi:hypothetical protein
MRAFSGSSGFEFGVVVVGEVEFGGGTEREVGGAEAELGVDWLGRGRCVVVVLEKENIVGSWPTTCCVWNSQALRTRYPQQLQSHPYAPPARPQASNELDPLWLATVARPDGAGVVTGVWRPSPNLMPVGIGDALPFPFASGVTVPFDTDSGFAERM